MLVLNKEQYQKIHKEITERGYCKIENIGTIMKKPARMGRLNGTFGGVPKYKYRPAFRYSRVLKEQLNK
jgi:nucleoid DNA-binding protein